MISWLQKLFRRYLAGRAAERNLRQLSKFAEKAPLLPREILVLTYEEVHRALAAEKIQSWIVSAEFEVRSRIGIDSKDKEALVRALERLAIEGYWLRTPELAMDVRLADIDISNVIASSELLVLFRPRKRSPIGATVAGAYSCEIEIWERHHINGATYMIAPRENRAAKQISLADFELVDTTWHNIPVKTPRVLTLRMLDDVTFPIDVVYTWVDGQDPVWRQKRGKAEAASKGTAFHPEATMDSRFEDHEELRYSLRSIDSYAPWVRNIYIVTDQQVPSWLDTTNPRIRLVDHREIFPDERLLPNFNSNSIISCLHHIEGLSEHYIYMNDDVFLARWMVPDQFFTASGLAKVSPANNRRPFAEPRLEDEPHLNLTRNIRELLFRKFGIVVSRAIKHTPHPQLRSLNYELEAEFGAEYARTWSHQFRHHTDIVADQLHHYYAQIVGKAVASAITYDYINIQDLTHVNRLTQLLQKHHRDTFCLNDSPVPGISPIPFEKVAEFLEMYFPVPSTFEK